MLLTLRSISKCLINNNNNNNLNLDLQYNVNFCEFKRMNLLFRSNSDGNSESPDNGCMYCILLIN